MLHRCVVCGRESEWIHSTTFRDVDNGLLRVEPNQDDWECYRYEDGAISAGCATHSQDVYLAAFRLAAPFLKPCDVPSTSS